MSKQRTVLVVLAAAATVLTGGGPAQAGPDRWTGNATAEARPGVAQKPLRAERLPGTALAARKPLRAERRTDIDALACGTSIDQPGGPDTTIAVTYNNCSDATLVLTPAATASDGSGGTITYTSACQEFLPGEAWFWEIEPELFARSPTFLYRVTECL